MGRINSFGGVRQGDPLSPLLFVLAQQIFSSNLKREISERRMIEYKVGRDEISISHLFYTNDVLIFTNGSARSLNNLMNMIRSYEQSSGQMVNIAKSSFYISPKSVSRIPHIQRITGISPKQFPVIYLGVPIFQGERKMVYFEYLIDKVRRVLEGWKARLQSLSGRLILIKSVLNSIPIYTMASAYVPKGTIKRLEQIIRNFLWDVQGSSRAHWVKRDDICLPMEEGGLGIRRLNLIQDGLHGKLMWQILQGKSLWARFAKMKFFRDGRFITQHTKSPLWDSIAGHLPTLSSASQCLVGQGDISFWGDNWLGEILHGPSPCDRFLTVSEALPIFRHLVDFIPTHRYEDISRVVLDADMPDRLVFKLLDNGDFSTKLYCEKIRTKGIRRGWASRVWQNNLLPKSAYLLWKLMRHAVSVDNRVQTRGIPFVSRCRCCSEYDIETITHLFIKSKRLRLFGLALDRSFASHIILNP